MGFMHLLVLHDSTCMPEEKVGLVGSGRACLSIRYLTRGQIVDLVVHCRVASSYPCSD